MTIKECPFGGQFPYLLETLLQSRLTRDDAIFRKIGKLMGKNGRLIYDEITNAAKMPSPILFFAVKGLFASQFH